MKPNFATITGRFLGRTKEQWEAEKERTGMTDEQLIAILRVDEASRAMDQRNIRFFRSGKLGTPESLNE